MKNRFKKVIFVICFSIIVSIVLIILSNRSPESEFLGSIKLTSVQISSLALQISKSHAQPYRLRFESPGVEIGKISVQESLEVYLENNDATPLVIYLNSKKANVTIASKCSEKIFNGKFKDFLLAGRSEYEDLTIISSKDRKVNATLKFVRLSGSATLTVNVGTWRIRYGL